MGSHTVSSGRGASLSAGHEAGGSDGSGANPGGAGRHAPPQRVSARASYGLGVHGNRGCSAIGRIDSRLPFGGLGVVVLVGLGGVPGGVEVGERLRAR